MVLSAIVGSCDLTTACLGLVVGAVVLYFYKSRRPKNMPPGPMGLPVVGYVPFMGSNAAEKIMKMKDKYGPLVRIQIGTEDWIFVNGYEAINQVFVKKGETFSGRPSNELIDYFTGGWGLIMLDYGDLWKSQRKFGLMTLRGFGVGKKGMELDVTEETPYLIENLTNGPGSLRKKLLMCVSNIICRVVFGSRFAYDDDRFLTITGIFDQFSGDTLDAKLLELITLVPKLQYLPFFKSAMKRVTIANDKYTAILRGITEEHKATFQDNEIRDFIDAFIKEMKSRDEGDPGFHEKQLFQYVRDLFEAGTGTTSSVLYWAIFILAHRPEYQDRIVKEIENVMGESGTPTMKHQDEMPFTCAFIHEILRTKPLAPLGVFHKSNEACNVNGYDIPKNTTITPNIWSVQFDPEVFENPDEFNPDRFIDEEGKFVKSNYVIPFSLGPRHCVGKQLARMEIFIFLAGILQRLRIVPDPQRPLPPFESGVNSIFAYEANNYEVLFERR